MQCPHCLQHFHEDWKYEPVIRDGTQKTWGVGSTICPACSRAVITLGTLLHAVERAGVAVIPIPNPHTFRLVYPKGISRSPMPSEVPPEFATDYSEACLVLPDSEKASAALSRRCLQHLLREKAGVKKDDLAKEIQQVLDSKQLPTHLAEDLDATSGITSKPAIEDHFKTGQRNIILDEPVLPYRMAVWQPQSDPIRPLSSDHQPGILQNLIPVFSSFRR